MAPEPRAIDLVEPSDGDVTKEWLEKELENAQDKLEKRVNKIERDYDNDDSDDDYGLEDHKGTPLDQLYELHDTVEALALSQEVTQWASDCSNNNTADVSSDDIFRDAHDCEALAQILCRHDSHSSLYQNLFEKEYQPLHTYVRLQLILQLRSILRQAGYPAAEGCGALFAAVTISPTPLTQCCECLTRLQVVHHQVTQHTHQTSGASTPWASGETCDVLTEFLRPLVERVNFHFVQFSNDRVTSTKVDRLPEWLLTYLQEHVLEGKPAPKAASTATSSSPWELITMGLAPYVTESMPILFANELVGLIKYVLSERNYFRDHKIAGPESNPMLLCNAIEQLLAFDDALRNLMPMGQADRLLRLMDIFVAGDEELLSWWLAREKEMVFSTLFDNTTQENADSQAKQRNKLAALVKTRISPRAELFCALIRSVQMKASVFSFSGPYLNAVAVPLCMQFLDAVHESATDLRKVLAGPLPASSAAAEAFLASNIEDWISVFNGTRLAAVILTRENPWAQQSMAPSNTSSVNDLARFGRSLEQLQNVLVEEFATTFVESFLMERVKLASYLMRCSHFLSHSLANEDDDDDDDYDSDISQDLKPSYIAMSKFISICKDCELESMEDEGESSFAIEFAPRMMQAKVVPMLAEKFMEVAINLQGLTPEVIPEGASIFARDVETLFGNFSPHAEPSVRFLIVGRLLDVTRLMALPAKSLVTLQSALLGLVGGPEDPSRPWHLGVHQFTADANLFEEAVSMLHAKGFMLELEDAISVLNRRRDLMTM